MNRNWKLGLRVLSYILVVAATAAATVFCTRGKLDKLEDLIQKVYIEQVDWQSAEDAAAAALVDALPDDWSYYISARDYGTYQNDKKNSYEGVGMTVMKREDGAGFDIKQVEPDSNAQKAGILPGDILVQVDDTSVAGMDVQAVADLIRGAVGDSVRIGVLRQEQTLEFTVVRQKIDRQVSVGTMLEGDIGYISVANFNENSADQAIEAVDALVEEGAKALVFDMRNNPGGYKDQMVQLLDHLLPEGDLFRSVDYQGKETVDRSDENCVELPMAVLINGDSYSAAEFFAAALAEYEWAVTVGEPTVGKGHFQLTYELGDGSAVALSVGKYYTPKGVSLSDAGGLVPDVTVEVDQQTAAMIYAQTIDHSEDPQLQAAVEALTEKGK